MTIFQGIFVRYQIMLVYFWLPTTFIEIGKVPLEDTP